MDIQRLEQATDGSYILDKELKLILLKALKDGFLTIEGIGQITDKTVGSRPKIIIGNP
jgi:hypothetical protein